MLRLQCQWACEDADRRYGALARFAAAIGAEWSLFCPGIGMAVDSCAALIEVFDRSGVGSTLAASAGANTAPADGTDVSVAGDAVADGSFCTGWTIGAEGLLGALSQALSNSKLAPSAIAVKEKRMNFLVLLFGNRQQDLRAGALPRLCDIAHV